MIKRHSWGKEGTGEQNQLMSKKEAKLKNNPHRRRDYQTITGNTETEANTHEPDRPK